MKKLLKNEFGQILLSVTILGIFILLALGSVDMLSNFMSYDMTYLGNGIYEERDYFGRNGEYYNKTTGNRDQKGRWQGPVTIYHGGSDVTINNYYEEVTMVDGKRHGTCKSRYRNWDGSETIYTKCYNMGEEIPCTKSAGNDEPDKSAYQVLSDKYSWYFFGLLCFEFDSTYVESYLDTLETLLYANEFAEEDFDSYYEDVQDSLSETPYDSIIVMQTFKMMFLGLGEMKNAEFRLAVIDHYHSAGIPTHDIITTTYPGYLQDLISGGMPGEEFEQFCQDLDDSLASYGPLDPEDPFYVDSVDSYLFRALYGIMDMDLKSTLTTAARLDLKRELLNSEWDNVAKLHRHFRSILKSALSPSGSSDVAQYVLADMLSLFMTGDINRRVVREAYNLRKGIVTLPVVTTEFMGNASATSVHLQGHVIEDGGATVTARGMAWGETYNPVVDDNDVGSGTGTGSFEVTLNGLTEGKTYYARTYAANSAGTMYGNCIEFVAATPSGIQDINLFAKDFTVYPNPAKASATFSFRLGSSAGITLKITDMKGRVVFYHDAGMMPGGDNRFTLDISGLGNGMYNCQLTNGTEHVVRKLEIVR